MISIVICTKDRVHDLFECLKSIKEQNYWDIEVIISDASCIENKQKIREVIGKVAVDNFLIKIIDSRLGLTIQRNTGVDCSIGDIILFIDDDVILYPDYLININKGFEQYANVMGIMGLMRDKYYRKGFKLSQFLKWFFKMSNDFTKKSYMQASGYPSFSWNILNDTPTNVLNGCMALRKDVFKEFRFDEKLSGYGLMEDVDFSYRVSKKYQLMQISNAICYHNYSKASRQSLQALWCMRVENHFYLFNKNMNTNLINRMSYIWAEIGYGLFATLDCIRNNTVGPIIGYLNGYNRIISKRSINQ
jgi:GT2 family glycosyltransferase